LGNSAGGVAAMSGPGPGTTLGLGGPQAITKSPMLIGSKLRMNGAITWAGEGANAGKVGVRRGVFSPAR
jgi:hypothetical protein